MRHDIRPSQPGQCRAVSRTVQDLNTRSPAASSGASLTIVNERYVRRRRPAIRPVCRRLAEEASCTVSSRQASGSTNIPTERRPSSTAHLPRPIFHGPSFTVPGASAAIGPTGGRSGGTDTGRREEDPRERPTREGWRRGADALDPADDPRAGPRPGDGIRPVLRVVGEWLSLPRRIMMHARRPVRSATGSENRTRPPIVPRLYPISLKPLRRAVRR